MENMPVQLQIILYLTLAIVGLVPPPSIVPFATLSGCLTFWGINPV